jgi:hypothetical protein
MSETIIPASNRTSKKHPGENQKYVGSRAGGPEEAKMSKNASIKHENPEYFKRQSDRKHADAMGPKGGHAGVGAVGVKDSGRGIGAVGKFDKMNEKGRGVGAVGANDSKKKDSMIPARKDVPIQRDFNKHQANVGKDPGRGVGQTGVDSKKKR